MGPNLKRWVRVISPDWSNGTKATPPAPPFVPPPGWFSASSAQDVQVNRRVLDQGQQAGVEVLDDHPLLGLPLPAALHQQVHLLGAGARPLQFPSLRDAFDGLFGDGNSDTAL